MSHTALEIEASKEVALGVINVDVTGIVVANEPLQDESMPPDFAHKSCRLIDFGSAFYELLRLLIHAALKSCFLRDGLFRSILPDVLRDVAESATTRQIHPTGSL